MRFPTVSSESAYPDGPLRDLVARDSTLATSLRSVLTCRRAAQTRAARGRADWAYSFNLVRRTVADGRLTMRSTTPATCGLKAVYDVCRAMWEYASTENVAAVWAEYEAFIRESVLASASASHLDLAAADSARRRAVAAIRATPAPALL